jgi:hypothetical protein
MHRLLKHRWLWATVLLAAVVAAGYALVSVGDHDNRMDGFKKLDGLTAAEVEWLGGQPAEWRRDDDELEFRFENGQVFYRVGGSPPAYSWWEVIRHLWP